jgi:hypothetical protein
VKMIELEPGLWVDPEEVAAICKDGGTVVHLRGGGKVYPALSVTEVARQLRRFVRRTL